MPAQPLFGKNAIVKWTPDGGAEVTIKNASWTLKPKGTIKEAPNTTDGMLRAGGFDDYEGTVEGFFDVNQPIEGDIADKAVGTLKLYRTTTKFFSLKAIISGPEITTAADDLEQWSFSWQLQSGSLTKPV